MRSKPTKAKIKEYLKARRHRAGSVEAALTNQTNEHGLRTLHGVSAEEYKAAGGRQ